MLSAIINHLWQSTLFAGGVGVLTLMLHRNSARVRFGLWLCASLKFLLPFALLAALGSHIPRQPPHLDASPGAAQVLGMAIDRIVAPIPATGQVLGQAPLIAASVHPWLNLLGIVWACGVLAIAGYWLAGWSRIRRVLVASTPIAIDFPIPVRTSTIMQGPAVAGIVRPVLLVPDGIEGWLSTEQLRAVLAHERCHVSRRDNLKAALHMVVESLFWFHPLVWWLETRLIAERERACDEEVLADGNKAKDYAEGILRVCQNYLDSPLRCAAGVGGGDLARRIESILNPPRHVRLSALQMILLGGMASAVVAEPIVSGHLAAPFAQERDIDTSVFRNYVAVIPAGSPPSQGKDLIVAASNGNLAQVRSLLHKGVDVDFQDSDGPGITALTQAAQRGRDPAVVQELLASGAQVEHRRGGGETALILAGGSGNVAIVEGLLNAGAQVNDRDDNGVTALMTASENGHQGVVLLLLSSGADIHRENRNGETALELAARGGHDTVVRLLLDSGADFRHRRFTGETALDLAVQGRQVAVVQTLLERGAGAKR
jgi:beta-lactamase regulating signal transducer with metallopeptidase domain/ankyrin repeat protein